MTGIEEMIPSPGSKTSSPATEAKQIFSDIHPLLHRLAPPIILFMTLFAFGTIGYYLISPAGKTTEATIRTAVYQTAILLTTVGFGDEIQSSSTWAGTIFTMILAFGGMGIILYIVSTVTAFIVGGELKQILEAKRMQKKISELRNHYIICGGGETGRHVIAELLATNRPFVVLEIDSERIEKLANLGDLLYMEDDASDDDVLIAAGIERAHGLVSALPSDKDNLLTVITARQLNPNLRIVSRCIDLDNKKKITKAGADAVVAPNMIGGLRMVSEMIRPSVVTFLDTMLRDRRAIRFEDIVIPPAHKLVGKTLADANFSAIADVNIVATREGPEDDFLYNPRGSLIIGEGMDLIAIGTPEEIRKLQEHIGA